MAEPEDIPQLRRSESATTGLRRHLLAALESVRGRLRGTQISDDDVHELRRDLKRARAILRLLRPALRKPVYRSSNRELRAIGRRWGWQRDSRALGTTLLRLRQQTPDPQLREFLDVLQDELSASTGNREKQAALRSSRTVLARVLRRVHGWELAPRNWSVLGASLRRSYRKGRRSGRQAVRLRSDDAWHKWRKHTKSLWHQLQLVETVSPAVVAPLVRDAHRLGDRLGDDHDLAVLQTRLSGSRAAALQPELAQQLSRLIADRRAQLQADAARTGQRLFAEGQREFEARLKKSWRAWRTPQG